MPPTTIPTEQADFAAHAYWIPPELQDFAQTRPDDADLFSAPAPPTVAGLALGNPLSDTMVAPPDPEDFAQT